MHRKTLSILGLAGLYVALALVVNFLHFRYFPVRVVLYDVLLDVLIAGVLVLALYRLVLRSRLELTSHEVALTLLVGLLLGANYAISVPTVIDRSLSIYILEKLAQRGGAIRFDALPRVFTDEYLPEHRLVDIRVTEQLRSGTITLDNGCVRLTAWGSRIVAFTRFYRTNLLPKRREIMGEFSDALTDPFRNTANVADYKCAPPR